jgi:hydroxyacylglutathione hydrolase
LYTCVWYPEGDLPQDIATINCGGVNCYLIKTGTGYILIDTTYRSKREFIDKALAYAGCKPGNLDLIVLTHGDVDHAGNCIYLREKYSTKVAIHYSDSGIVEHGDASWNRKAKSDKLSIFFKVMMLASYLVKMDYNETFKPDILLDEDFDLSAYGLDARVIHLPGHSKGSIGVLTDSGDLFCGDLVYNFFGRPGLIYCINDLADYNISIEKLKHLDVQTVYPGHGKPFPVQRLIKNRN